MTEQWMPWRQYQISDQGRVKGPHGKELKLAVSSNGYRFFSASDPQRGRKAKTSTFVHRLVAELFVSNPSHLKQVHHIDHDKTNNAAVNLTWTTASENMLEAVKAGRCEVQRQKMRETQKAYLAKAIAVKIERYGSANARSARKDQRPR